MVFREVKERLERPDMAEILVKWILEAGFFPVNGLRPLPFLGVAKNPAGIMFGLDDEDAGVGDEDHPFVGVGPLAVWKPPSAALTRKRRNDVKLLLILRVLFGEIWDERDHLLQLFTQQLDVVQDIGIWRCS